MPDILSEFEPPPRVMRIAPMTVDLARSGANLQFDPNPGIIPDAETPYLSAEFGINQALYSATAASARPLLSRIDRITKDDPIRPLQLTTSADGSSIVWTPAGILHDSSGPGRVAYGFASRVVTGEDGTLVVDPTQDRIAIFAARPIGVYDRRSDPDSRNPRPTEHIVDLEGTAEIVRAESGIGLVRCYEALCGVIEGDDLDPVVTGRTITAHTVALAAMRSSVMTGYVELD